MQHSQVILVLVLKAPRAITFEFANNVDPDKAVHTEPFQGDSSVVVLHSCFCV